MKNLKRILSLALASTMLVGMLVVGANAAEFSDADKIKHTDAVNTLSALGILNGMGDGTFNPQGTLTRAQMAKMLATVFNKGDDDLSFAVNSAKPTFTDVKPTAWYAGAVEYAANFKIVNGMGDGTFAPEATLTTAQAARMILNAMGYSQGEGDWKLNTFIQARDVGIFDHLSSAEQVADKATRDAAAQMLADALTRDMEGNNTYEADANVYGTRYTISVNTTGESIIAGADAAAKAANKEKLEAMKFATATDATAMATTYGLTASTHYIIAKNDRAVVGTTKVDKSETLGHKYLGMATKTGVLTAVVYNADYDCYVTTIDGTDYPAEEDYSALMGQNVKVVYMDDNGPVSVYGLSANKGKVLFTGTVGDLPATTAATSIKVNGTEYKIDTKDASGNAMDSSNVVLYAYNTDTSAKTLDSHSGVRAECTMKGIDTTGDGKLDRIEYLPVEVVKVTNVTSKAIVTSPAVSAATPSVTLSTEADTLAVKAYEGIAKGDVVLATPAANTVSGLIELAKAETVTGDVTGINATTASTIRLGSDWYKQADGKLSATVPTLGAKDQTLTLVNGYYVSFSGPVAATSKDLVVVTAVAEHDTTSGFDSYKAVKVLDLATEEVKEIKGETTLTDSLVGQLGYLTDTDRDGLNEFVAVSATEKAGFDGYETAGVAYAAATGATINSKYIADDAKVVVLYKDSTNASDADKTDITGAVSDAKTLTASAVVDGKTLKGWKNAVGAATQTLTKNVNGIAYAQVVVLAIKANNLPGAAGTNGYGYIVGDAPYKITENKVTYLTYSVWNGEEVVEVKDTNTTARAVGDIIQFSDKGDGIITSEDAAITAQGYVTGYNEADGLITIMKSDKSNSGIANITENTTILFVDHTNKEGVADGEIVLATEDEEAPGKYTCNVWYKANGTTAANADLIVVEVNNDTGAAKVDTRVAITISGLANDTNFEVVKVTYNGEDILLADFGTADLQAKPGATLTVTVKATTAGQAQKKGCDIKNGGTSVGEIATLESGNQPATEQTIKVTVDSSAMTLTLADKS